jgi:hypothetical protein
MCTGRNISLKYRNLAFGFVFFHRCFQHCVLMTDEWKLVWNTGEIILKGETNIIGYKSLSQVSICLSHEHCFKCTLQLYRFNLQQIYVYLLFGEECYFTTQFNCIFSGFSNNNSFASRDDNWCSYSTVCNNSFRPFWWSFGGKNLQEGRVSVVLESLGIRFITKEKT